MGCCFCACAKVYTEIEINAPANIVYDILTDFDSYSEWNTFMVKSAKDTDELKPGTVLTNTMKPGSSEMVFTPTVTKVEQDKELEWLGTLGCRGIFDGCHGFQIEPLSDDKTAVRFIQSEEFYGCLIITCYCCKDCMIMNDTKAGFIRMNEEIKQRAEEKYKSMQ